jgi:hypothetical protein
MGEISFQSQGFDSIELIKRQASEQLVAPDASRTSASHAGCNRLKINCGTKSQNRLTCFVLGFGSNRHALLQCGLRR